MAGRQRKTMVGLVVSDKMSKTVVVGVPVLRRHPLYGRLVRQTRRYKAHDEENSCRTGDLVRIRESRPLSKEKRWQVAAILKRSAALPAAATVGEELGTLASGATDAEEYGERN